jgi:EamA domain-containing membrane protein RarD
MCMLRTIKERKKLFSACYIGPFGKQQLVAIMMIMITNEKNEKKKVCVYVCVCVHVCIFILRLIEEKRKRIVVCSI